MKEEDAFTAQPPTITLGGEIVTLRPFTPTLAQAFRRAWTDADNAAYVTGYIALASGTVGEAAALTQDTAALKLRCAEIDLGISEDDFNSVVDYANGIFDRTEAAEVEPSGKPEAG